MSERDDEQKEKDEIKVSASRPRKLKEIPLPSFNFDKGKNDKISIHFAPFALKEKKFLHNCVSRVSFNSGNNKESIASSTASSINYLMKNEDVPLLSSDEKLTDLNAALEFFEGKRILRIMISPEENEAPLEKCIEKTISYLEGVAGQKLTYLAAVHTDTDIRHAHIIISREDGGKCSERNLLCIPKEYLIGGARERMRYTITSELGFMSEDEYYEKYKMNINKLGSHKLDYLIEKKLVFYKGKAELTKYETTYNVPHDLKAPMIQRLDALSTFGKNCGVVKEENGNYTFYNTAWQEYLRTKDKSHVFEDITKFENVAVDNFDVFKKTIFDTYSGTLVAKKVIDDDIGKVAFLIKAEKDNSYHYAEATMQFPKYNFFEIGDTVKIYGSSSVAVYKNSKKRRDRIHIAKLNPETGKVIQAPRSTKAKIKDSTKKKRSLNETKY